MRALRIVYMGTPDFAVASLDAIHQSQHEVVAVITSPDRPAGRGRKVRSSAVKQYAADAQIDILQPLKLRDPEFQSALAAYEADLFVVVAFRMLPESVWAMPPLGTINLHGSLLPQYRGAAPINWAIINGETRTGVTTFYIDAEIDEGKIIDSRSIEISPDADAGALHDELMALGAELVLHTVDEIAAGRAKAIPQETDGLELRAAPKLFPHNRSIDWTQSAQAIHNLVRGLCPYPSALSSLHVDSEEWPCKIYKTQICESNSLVAGEIESDGRKYMRVGTGDGDLEILEIQLGSKKRLRVPDLLNGFDLGTSARFERSGSESKQG